MARRLRLRAFPAADLNVEDKASSSIFCGLGLGFSFALRKGSGNQPTWSESAVVVVEEADSNLWDGEKDVRSFNSLISCCCDRSTSLVCEVAD